MIIGDRLRALREEKKLSQGDTEKKTGLLRCYVSRVENGHTVPAVDTLEKFARALEVPMYQLFYDGEEPPKLTILSSPYRFVIVPVVQYVLQLSAKHPGRRIVVVIPELVEGHWYEYFLHNQRGRLLEWVLLAHGNKQIFTLSSPYYLS